MNMRDYNRGLKDGVALGYRKALVQITQVIPQLKEALKDAKKEAEKQ